jgi:YesN/AraC family two-component response regulator
MNSKASSKLDDQRALTDLLVLMKNKQDEMLASNHPHFIFLSPYSWFFYVHLLNNDGQYIILGPIQELPDTEKIQHLIRLCYWLFQSNDTFAMPQPTTFTFPYERTPSTSPDVSLLQIYYEQEFIHFPLEQGMYLKAKMLAGDIKAIQDYFDSQKNIQNELAFDHIELAKGDLLRSTKNHFIALCAVASTIAMEAGTDDEYARTIADKYILQVENIHSKVEIIKLIREVFLKFTAIIIEFSNPNYSALVQSTIQYMNTHFFEKITLNDVARKLGKNPSYISDKVNKETGLSFNANLNQIRIKESKQLLTHTQKSIHDIAIAVGFDYQNHFAKVFKKIVGVTPVQYRNKSGR